MKNLVKGALGLMAGKKRYQRLFESLYGFALAGMNIGGGAHTDSSGEDVAMDHVYNTLKDRKDPVIFDVGANVGEYANLLGKRFAGKARLFSFEPSARTYQQFVANTAQVKGLRHFNFGLSNADTHLTLYTDAEGSGLASVYHRRLDHMDIHMDRSERIELRTLDGFCAQEGITRIDFLKIDVEGHELKVLEGAKGMLQAGAIDFIQFEFGGCNIDSRTYFQDFFYLLKDDFAIHRIVKDGLHRIDAYKEMYEVFMTTNFLAERIKR
jgi:FkbM family methyltransferase